MASADRVIALASLFRRSDRTRHEVAEQSDPTIEVQAGLIARAATAAERAPSEADGGLDAGVTADLLDQALAERRTLVQLCLYALDRARSAGVVERLEEGLAGIGVVALRPDGARFDPAHHEAGGTVPTQDPALDGVVAETEVVGFADRGTVLRAPIVIVYKAQP